VQAIEPHLPVAHVSYYEAEAYARWAGARLATEAEWEALAATAPVAASSGIEPGADDGDGLRELYAACWQWTASAYAPYPGYRPAAGAIGEYNGKFMANQLSLRGSSCVTPPGHARATYRNFFYPAQRWQFTGIRLAKDL
jgi:formylglycine-generating enzyme required for sulfatase activity